MRIKRKYRNEVKKLMEEEGKTIEQIAAEMPGVVLPDLPESGGYIDSPNKWNRVTLDMIKRMTAQEIVDNDLLDTARKLLQENGGK